MKSLLITAIAALLLVGCGKSDGIWAAAEEGDLEAVKGYLANDVNVDARDDVYEGTSLHFAAFRGRKEVAELLINEGADVNAKNQADATPLDKAIEKKQDETVSLLRKHGGKTGEELKGSEPVVEATQPEPPKVKAPDILIHEAVAEGNIEAVKQYLNAGRDVNAKDEDSWTPLHFAASDGHKEVVELFIAKGADVNVKSRFGETPLDLAIINNETEIAYLLRKPDEKTNVTKDQGLGAESNAKLTTFTQMPEIDLSSFTKEQQATILARANKEGCDCGCSMTVAQCRNDDQTCGKGMALAKAIVKDVTGVDIKVAVAKPKADDRVGKPVDIKFTSIDGKKIDVSKMKGKVVLIDFWATWCGPCVAELPNVKRAYDKLHSKGFEIVGISLDSKESALRRFVKKEKMPWPQYFDGKGWKNSISTAHGIRSIPAMWLVDKQGNLADLNARPDLEGKVEELLAAPSPEAN